MSASQISDIELDRLLSQAPPPRAPAPDLADRIAARALRTPQERGSRFAFGPRHRPRRRATLWTAIIGANLMAAAAAAAASWDGQRFDFHRLADLPHRVATAVHIGHHHSEKVLVAHRKTMPLPRVAPPVRVAAASKVEASPARLAAGHAPVPRPMQLRARLVAHGIERPHLIERETAASQPAIRFRPYQHRVQVAPHRIARIRPIKRAEQLASTAPEHPLTRAPEASLRQERLERRTAAAEPQQIAPQPTASPPPREPFVQQRQATAEAEVRNDEYRRRLERWRNQLQKREHPRQRANRFRRRF